MNLRNGAIVLLAASGWLCALGLSVQAEPAKVFEMRTYHPAEGKTEAMHARFRDHTDGLFTKHGMSAVGYWVPTDKEKDGDIMVYILEHASREAAEKSWEAFRADPEWQKAKADSEVEGKLVEKVDVVFLQGTDYSKLR